MPFPMVLIWTLVLFVCALSLVLGRSLPTGFRERTCQGRAWRREFPKASKAQIRAFLQIFASAFGFDKTDSLRFSPHDSVLSVYRALYPLKWTPDALELETFAQMLEKRYGLRLEETGSATVTLGALFRAIDDPDAKG